MPIRDPELTGLRRGYASRGRWLLAAAAVLLTGCGYQGPPAAQLSTNLLACPARVAVAHRPITFLQTNGYLPASRHVTVRLHSSLRLGLAPGAVSVKGTSARGVTPSHPLGGPTRITLRGRLCVQSRRVSKTSILLTLIPERVGTDDLLLNVAVGVEDSFELVVVTVVG